MNTLPFLVCTILLTGMGCGSERSKLTPNKTVSPEIVPAKAWNFEADSVMGDFAGDGQPDLLYSELRSALDGSCITTIPFNEDFDEVITALGNLKPQVWLVSTNHPARSIMLAENEQLFGLSWLQNEGDLDGDGRDDISVVINWADQSGMNTCTLWSMDDNEKWHTFFSFDIREWQMDDDEQGNAFKGFIQHKKNKAYYESFDIEQGTMLLPLERKDFSKKL